MYIYWFSFESGYIDADDDDDADNAGRHSTTTRATYRQLRRDWTHLKTVLAIYSP